MYIRKTVISKKKEGSQLTLMRAYSAKNRGVFVWSRSAVAPLMYKKRKGLAGPAWYMALIPARVLV